MSIAHWPVNERPREKLLEKGAAALSDAELLAIFLRTGVKGKSAVDLSRELLTEFGSLNKLLNAEYQQFTQSHGLGTAKYVQLQAVLEMAKRNFAEQLADGTFITNPGITKQYLISELQDYPYEYFACLFLDNRHRVIKFEKLFRGSINAASIYPREVAKQALNCNAAAIIFAHNHPSGYLKPSRADIEITQQLKDCLNLFEIRVLDHFIIGKGDAYSLAEHGEI